MQDKPMEPAGDDEAGYTLTCDVCGVEKHEDVVSVEGWISFGKDDAFEVLVCANCAESEEKLANGFDTFLAAKREYDESRELAQ
jgi:hypothetical protein